MNENGYNNHIMFCINNNYLPDKIYARDLNYDILCKIFDNFYSINNFLPTRDDLNWGRYNLPHLSVIEEICGDKLKEFYNKYKLNIRYYYPKSYKYYCDKFIEIYNNVDIGARYIYGNYDLPGLTWFIKNCPQKINNSNDFINHLGLIPKRDMTKTQAIESILNTKENLGRNLMYHDFQNTSNTKNISISIINKIWGTFNNMLTELNLPINQEDMVSKGDIITIEMLCEDVKKQCIELTKKNKINIINGSELKDLLTYNRSTYDKYFKKELSINLLGYVQLLGYQTIEAGRGLNYTFPDGEKILSKHEFDFSLFLRNILQLQYNVDYKKDIKYKIFIEGYKKQSSIDYIINYNNRIIYIEIAGMLKNYKQWYLDDKPLKSRSREKYRLSLKEKERTLKYNRLEYYILFPQDLSEDFLLSVFN